MLLEGKRRLTVSNFRVACPLQGVRDLEYCLACRYLDAVDLERPDPAVACRVPDALSPFETFGLYGKE